LVEIPAELEAEGARDILGVDLVPEVDLATERGRHRGHHGRVEAARIDAAEMPFFRRLA
jgi:hypothetical protein